MSLPAASVRGSSSPATTLAPSSTASESLFSRLIVAPVLFISFLISLFLIDRQTSGSVLGHEHDDQSHRGASGTPRTPHEEYYRSNKRKLARKEMEEAFQLRSRVIALIVLVAGVSVALLGWSGQKVVSSVIWGSPCHSPSLCKS